MRALSLVFLALFAVGFIFAPSASAEPVEVTFHWDYDDASAFNKTVGFKVYMRAPDAAEYANTPWLTITRDDACQSGPGECCMLGDVDGQHLFVVTAYNDDGEFEPSNEVEYIPFSLAAPTAFKAQITFEGCN